jgi:hypothetical protein
MVYFMCIQPVTDISYSLLLKGIIDLYPKYFTTSRIIDLFIGYY